MKNGHMCQECNRKEWRLNGLKHRIKGPAVIYNNGKEEYWFMGKRHRIDGPAVIEYEKIYVFNTHNFEKKRRNMPVADMCKDMTHTKKVCREEYWYNDRKYSKEDYDFIILFQRADKDRRYI